MYVCLGAHPGNLCTGNAFYGCQRQGTSTNYLNVIQSARLRTAETFAFKYGRIEVRAQVPRGDWIWPGG
jgi:beta-glucanase (GH16 family)